MAVIWSASARRDFDNALRYLQPRSQAGAKRMGERILAVASLLEQFPELAPPSRYRSLRQLVVPRTPYLVIYRLNGGDVEIRAIVHAKQRRRR
ncbi:MAG: type II toxin-antitoxin system RelE/ParE family toxin [Hyphomonadaceae bacterium]|nr:type II toxin-antitoxin system RelE/ParE family toxin [Hyphomonadaceae bacterium]